MAKDTKFSKTYIYYNRSVHNSQTFNGLPNSMLVRVHFLFVTSQISDDVSQTIQIAGIFFWHQILGPGPYFLGAKKFDHK